MVPAIVFFVSCALAQRKHIVTASESSDVLSSIFIMLLFWFAMFDWAAGIPAIPNGYTVNFLL